MPIVNPQPPNVTGLVLAGGRGIRMGKVDKGLQVFGDQTMVEAVLQRFEPQVATLMINANQNIATYAGFGHPVWPDELTGFAGPLAGLQVGLTHCVTPWLVMVPCDSPFLPLDLVQGLHAAQQQNDFDIAVAVTGRREQRQVHPVFCLVRVSLLPHLDAYLANGGRKVREWYSSLRVVEVPFDNGEAFRNINTQDELRLCTPREIGNQT